MPVVDAVVSCAVRDSFRVQQVAGLFDVPWQEKSTRRFAVEVPGEEEPWQIGLIAGPSGSGKSTIARAAFGERLYAGGDWPADRAVVDCLDEVPIKELTGLLTAVGLGSPPAWIRPFDALSNGERFRCELARALSVGLTRGDGDALPVVVFDEYTSVVDRGVARFGSAALAKGVRTGRLRCRFVAVTCHYDVAEWLEPDWVVDMASQRLVRGCLRRPSIELEIFRAERDAWRMFAAHHYLSGELNRAARCYLGVWNGVPVSFCATLSLIAKRRRWRVSRVVTLPDFQGLGLGMQMVEAVGDLHRQAGERLNMTASHPAVIAHCRRSTSWRTVKVRRGGPDSSGLSRYRGAGGRAMVSFEYLGRAA